MQKPAVQPKKTEDGMMLEISDLGRIGFVISM